MKPVIGITTFWESGPKKVYSTVSNHYIRSVELAGGLPVLLPSIEDYEMTDQYLSFVDALLITGGNEAVSPLLYGENPVKEVLQLCPERDLFEIRLVQQAFEKKMPILGVCRGHQLLNVAMGGSLYQDIFTQVPGCLGHNPPNMPVDTLYHDVRIEENSLLSKIFGKERINVNSFHHQAVKETADGFRATAFSSDGIIEAMEYTGDNNAVGIQWHPEDLTVRHPEFVGLFRFLVDAAKEQQNAA